MYVLLLGRKFEIKFLPLVFLYNFVSTNKELNFFDKRIINTQPLTIPVAFVLNQLVFIGIYKKDFSFQIIKKNNRSAAEV